MDALAIETIATDQPVLSVCVSDLARAQRFFGGLFGLTLGANHADADAGEAILSPSMNGRRAPSLRLVQRPSPMVATTLMLELETSEDLLDVYMLGRLLGGKALGLARHQRRLVARLSDLDGNLIEISAPAPVLSGPASRGDSARLPAAHRDGDESSRWGPSESDHAGRASHRSRRGWAAGSSERPYARGAQGPRARRDLPRSHASRWL